MAARKKTKTAPLASQPDRRAALDGAAFLSAAKKTLVTLHDDLLARADGSAGVTVALRAEHARVREAKRTADEYEPWRRRVVVQIAAAWILSVVFARTLEDRGLLDRNRIAGAGAADSQRQFLDLAPYLTEREYLLTVFRELSNLPAAKELFDPEHNPVWTLAPSAEGARALLALFRDPDADAPAFRFGQADTRFLGDLYQDLDDETRERYALLQTPHFVEAFILDQTLEPAIRDYGLAQATLLDPTCGSGHFLLGAFDRLFDHWLRAHPGLDVREAAAKALDLVHGTDVNPYAVAIARFRLTLAFLDKGGYTALAAAPAIPLHVAVADSLLHGRGSSGQATLAERPETEARAWLGEMYSFTDEGATKAVLAKQYAAVVGNPPYITVKDAALREEYRKLYSRSASGKYSLAAPFCERFFDLARDGGFVGMITANSFMKREFGKKLIEDYLKSVDLQTIVNTSGAYIPGHGTPTVLLFGRRRAPVEGKVLAVLAKRGEPATPEDPEQGHVWRSIADHLREVGFENDYVSVAMVERGTLGKHPWSLGGGGAAELKELLEERAEKRLKDIATDIGFDAIMGEDELFAGPADWLIRMGCADHRPLVIGEAVRDWAIGPVDHVIFPYRQDLSPDEPKFPIPYVAHFWRYRQNLIDRRQFGKNTLEAGLAWFEYRSFYKSKRRTPVSIAFAFVATHNHFVLDRGGKVFNRSAPIIKLPEGATEEEHLALLAYLNSSTACFWMKQVMMNKGGSGIGRGVQDEAWEARFEFDGTKLQSAPLPALELLEVIGRSLDEMASSMRLTGTDLDVSVDDVHTTRAARLAAMCAQQENLDWLVYERFGLLTDDDLALLRAASADDATPDMAIPPGHRPFELMLAADPNSHTAWFERNSYDRPKLPLGHSERWMRLSDARRTVIERNALVALIEQPEHKRRWTVPDVAHTLDDMRTSRALDAIEDAFRAESHVKTFRGEPSPAISAVPFLAALRYTPSGLEKRALWERTWALQRREDAGEDVGPIPVPPKYGQEDFRDAVYWRLRGKLDVPKERFISYPGCESDEDRSPVYGWAGWNHLEQALALATLYMKRKTEEAWGKERLVPMLAGLDELVPWIRQWHAEPSPDYNGLPGDYFADFVAGQCHELGVSLDEVRAWRPEDAKKARAAAKAAKKAAAPKRGKKKTAGEEAEES